MRIVYSLIPATSTEIDALHNLLDRCCPEDAVMRDDAVRFRESVAAGECRLEPYAAESHTPGALLEGNPA
jgi:hypothetical protein